METHWRRSSDGGVQGEGADALGEAASKLRGELGESLVAVQKFNVPLVQATTSSLEALQAVTLGLKAVNEKGSATSVPYFQRAIQLDPKFAMAYALLSSDYFNLNEPMRASEYMTQAFQLQEHASEPEKLIITTGYYSFVTGELDKAVQAYRQMIETYPREPGAYQSLGLMLGQQGHYQEAMETTRQGAQLTKHDEAGVYVGFYVNLAYYALALQRFDEAREIMQKNLRKGTELSEHFVHYAIDFHSSDSAAMTDEEKHFASESNFESFGLSLASDSAAFAGHLTDARELTKRAVQSASQVDNKETGAIWSAIAAQREAAYGHPLEARQLAAEALKLAPTSQGVEVEAALALAFANDAGGAETLVQDLMKRFPVNTHVQSLWIPAIQAQVALSHTNSTVALNELQRLSSPLEYGQIPFVINVSCLYPTYIRGEALLGGRTRRCCRRRVSEDHRPQRHRVELLDGSVGASGRGSR